jgi:hypothetical protein
MRSITIALTAIAAAALACACATGPSPTKKAVQAERLQCSDPKVFQESQLVLQTATALEARAVVFPLAQGGGRVSGTKLIVRPPEGMTSDEFARALQCHAALAALGQIDRSLAAMDPTWLPQAWVDMKIVPENGNVTVTLSAETNRDNLRVYRRAVAFVDSQHGRASMQGP